MTQSRTKTVLITGCTPGGIGAALCEEFRHRGFHVLATVRTPSKAASLSSPKPADGRSEGSIEVLPLDVTSKESIEKCKAQLKTNGIEGLDVLVNNAGGLLTAPMLDMDIEDGKKMFDVNVWGLLAVTQAFAPLLIANKGCILNITSVAGALKQAWQGGYNASKAAATFFSETLRIEVEPLGLRVVTAMVGEVQSQIWEQQGSYKLPEGSYYKSVEKFIVDQADGKKQSKEEPAETVAKSLVDDVLSGISGQTWRGGQAGAAKNALRFVPSKLFERILHKDRGVDKITAPASK
ncbi:oxidoreductase like protein [Zymoseptoria brevis]|uniref:Oxidoreductase like protein n=1 Tax=Zymoseptoria brevis TaxID=1047168 RepID=A0A0F4G965_9PEZI|nr:oxidoreductase like protein [Zymoseptoria brevis]